jgi:hypothetical protein
VGNVVAKAKAGLGKLEGKGMGKGKVKGGTDWRRIVSEEAASELEVLEEGTQRALWEAVSNWGGDSSGNEVDNGNILGTIVIASGENLGRIGDAVKAVGGERGGAIEVYEAYARLEAKARAKVGGGGGVVKFESFWKEVMRMVGRGALKVVEG